MFMKADSSEYFYNYIHPAADGDNERFFLCNRQSKHYSLELNRQMKD